jgi:hypothetical protein
VLSQSRKDRLRNADDPPPSSRFGRPQDDRRSVRAPLSQAAPAAPLARRQRRALPWEARQAHAGATPHGAQIKAAHTSRRTGYSAEPSSSRPIVQLVATGSMADLRAVAARRPLTRRPLARIRRLRERRSRLGVRIPAGSAGISARLADRIINKGLSAMGGV